MARRAGYATERRSSTRSTAAKMAQERSGQSMQATALVHEAHLRLSGEHRQEPWQGRRQFFAGRNECTGFPLCH